MTNNHNSNTNSNSIFDAILNGKLDTVKKLVRKGANINETDDGGMTPLIYASALKATNIAKLLIDAGADINKVEHNGFTPLHVACDEGGIEIVKLLIENGADINKANRNGDIALHMACHNGHIGIVRLLIDAGADINNINKYNETPLSIVCNYDIVDIAKLLIEKGAIITDELIEGAEDDEFEPEIIELLLSNGNNTNENNISDIILNQVNRLTVTGNLSPSQCFNPYEGDTVNITPNLTVFYQLNVDGTVAAIKCIDEDAYDYYTKDKKNIFYKCKDTVPTSAVHIRRKDTVGDAMCLLRFDTMIFVPASQAKAIQKGRMYVLKPTAEPVGRIVSQSVIEGGTVVGASHCGPATQDVLYNIKEIKEPQVGGKRRKSISTRSA